MEYEINPTNPEEGNKVIPFPGAQQEGNTAAEPEAATATAQPEADPGIREVFQLKEGEDITEEQYKQIGKLVATVRDNVRIMQDIWFSTMREYGLKDEQMKALYQFNQQNRDPMPDGLTAEQKAQWDFSNGIQKMTQEDMDKIFEPGHPIWGVDMTQTIDRVKQTFDEFVQWMSSVQELRKVTDAYAELGELYEEQQFAELRKIAEAETDPEKKATKLKAIDDYMDNKTLAFMAAPQKEEDINRILHALTDTRKVEYWLKRTGDKLKQVKIAGTFVPEIYGFEKMLDEKYHKCKDIILLYFMQLIIYCDCHDPKSERRMQVLYFFRTMDAYIQNRLAPSVKEKTTQNLYAFLDQFIDKIPDGVNGATALQK